MVNKKSICLFCSLGCQVAFKTAGDHVLAIDYDGPLCPRGHYNFELLNHPARLTEPQIGERKVSWAEALAFLGHRLKEFNPDSVGIVLSANASNEDAYLAAKLAKVLGIKNIASAGDPADQAAYEGGKWQVEGVNLAQLEDIDNSEALLIIGDILTRSPVLSKRINKVKYGKRGNQIIVIDPNNSHTAWFATTQLKNQPGTEAMLLAAMIKVVAPDKIDLNLDKAAKTIGIPKAAIEQAAKDFSAAASGTIIFAPSATIAKNDLVAYLAKVLASLSSAKKNITFYGYGNTLGVNTVLDQMLEDRVAYSDVIRKIEDGQLKALLMLGEDISASHPELAKKIRHLKFVAMSNYFATDLADDSRLLLPLASQMEGAASYTLADGRTEQPKPVAPEVGGRTNLEILASLLNTEIYLEKIKNETKGLLAEPTPAASVELKEKVSEIPALSAGGSVAEQNITHFGNNSLVENFFWYRVNNG
ncbi:molybdopterin oxidoreductase family protein [Candidatus Margulisiibacteriota bacterium]